MPSCNLSAQKSQSASPRVSFKRNWREVTAKAGEKRALKREEVLYAAPGLLQMGSTCPQLPQPGGAGCHQPCSSRVWLAVVPPHCHVLVSRCSPGALQGAIPQLAHLCYLLQIPHKLCAEPKSQAHGENAQRKISRSNHTSGRGEGPKKCCQLPPDDPKPSGLATRPYPQHQWPTAQPLSAAEPTPTTFTLPLH